MPQGCRLVWLWAAKREGALRLWQSGRLGLVALSMEEIIVSSEPWEGTVLLGRRLEGNEPIFDALPLPRVLGLSRVGWVRVQMFYLILSSILLDRVNGDGARC